MDNNIILLLSIIHHPSDSSSSSAIHHPSSIIIIRYSSVALLLQERQLAAVLPKGQVPGWQAGKCSSLAVHCPRVKWLAGWTFPLLCGYTLSRRGGGGGVSPAQQPQPRRGVGVPKQA